MDKFHIKKILYEIAEKTYGKIKPFNLEIFVEERKTFHGDYYPATATIRIFNMSRPIDHIISTTIHELAHHVDFCLNNSSGHNKRFYGIFRKLMETAIKCGYIDYNIARSKTDSDDILKMEKYYGPITVRYEESMNTHKDVRIIKVANSYHIKDILSSMGFKFNGIEKVWQKETTPEEAESLKKEIDDGKCQITICDFNKMTNEAHYYVIVSKNTYQHKDELSKNGYKYKGYFINENAWVKKIKTEDLNKEKVFLQRIGLEYRLKN